MIRVGIPRSLLYYRYYPMWKTFFEALGAEVVVSGETNREHVARGSARVVAETCLPVKVYLGHVASLAGKCDVVFIPVLRSVKQKVYNCSKFLGLPDMTRAVVPGCPPVLEIEIDVNRKRRELYRAIYELGRHFTWNPVKIRRAALMAWHKHLEYRELMLRRGCTPLLALERLYGTPAGATGTNSSQGTIAVIGHPYLLYDEYINQRLIHRLEETHHRVVTPEMLDAADLERGTNELVGRAYWAYEEDVSGAGTHYLEDRVDGVIGVAAFGCGPDSLMMDMVRRHAARLSNTPFMGLTLEEHTAETGTVTRLEAFLDLIHRRKKKRAEQCG